MADQRADTGGRFLLDINGENAGFVKTFSGFAVEADIVSNDLGRDNVQKKCVTRIRWTPGKATIGERRSRARMGAGATGPTPVRRQRRIFGQASYDPCQN